MMQYENKIKELEEELEIKNDIEKMIKTQLNDQMTIFEQKEKDMIRLRQELEFARKQLSPALSEKIKLQSEKKLLLDSQSPSKQVDLLKIDLLEAHEGKSAVSGNGGCSSSFKDVFIPQRYITSSKISVGFNSDVEYKNFRALVIKCMEYIPINLIKNLDALLQALQKYLNMSPEEMKELMQKRQSAKADPPSKHHK